MKKIMTLAAFLLTAGTLAGCGGTSSHKPDPYSNIRYGENGTAALDKLYAAYGSATEVEAKDLTSCWIWTSPERTFCFQTDGFKSHVLYVTYKAKDMNPVWDAQ